ncbi:MAG: 1-(5-phosphoribosyl)-5-[(5-phosphoribosylamino)methylideneamino]imidazole-4-carboxamide isomerase [Veillonellaceae bacterium]|nr:1-(5-phosphoribosyl)-5-[(5-phosphoribosylamino)methylideneamino]imidazole-4-carboxamide isomerase [Veillonellaceae bacterium]
MIVFPAIDIRGGKCVRLEEGRFDRETVFAENPLEAARRWIDAGSEWLHIVDLDGARAGQPINLEVVKKIAGSFDVKIQLGGGVRTLESVATILSSGVQRVILGSVAVRSPELVSQVCAKYGEQIVIGIDARNGEVAVDGWEKSGLLQADELALRMKKAGATRIIYTDISRDGMLTGVNVAATLQLADKSGLKVIASGGVRGLEDIQALQPLTERGVEGVIIGKALYTGAISLKDALRVAQGGNV